MPLKVALVNMPFGFHIYPSIQMGTLSTLLKTHGWEVKSFYLNLYFAHKLELPVYNQLCEKRFLIGEWLFSHLLVEDSQKNKEYMGHFSSHIQEVCQSIGCSKEFLLDVKTKMAPEFLKWALEAFDWEKHDVVGFTSTFNQNVASLTLAKLIKEKYPSIKIIFGGSNFQSEMGLEYFRVFQWIDYAVVGEAENVLPGLLDAVEKGGTIPRGAVYRKKGKVVYEENRQMFVDFEKYGAPDYDDYFKQLKEIDPASPLLENPIILYETARGCWWGEKHHCKFCGLNALTMNFRAKAIEKIHTEIASLSKRYDSYRFRLVDNILDMKYIDGIFGKLGQENYDLQFFIEVKSNLNREQIKTVAYGGAKVIQPGIESFSAKQLNEMNKGVLPIQNILFLKWAFYYGIEVSWNILTGFPGETDEDYRRQIDIIKSIIHLQPPTAVGNLWLERFSPYFNRPDNYGVKINGPGEGYSYVYHSAEIDLMKIAYDFEFETRDCVDPKLKAELRQAVAEWKKRDKSEQTPFLFFAKSMDFVTVYDGRPKGQPTKTRFVGPPARIISFCNESPKSFKQIISHIEEKGGQKKDEIDEIEKIVKDLENKRILFEERGKYFTLALPHNSHY
ncbi:MAG: RiPP maturation radical SAM C-methyltransferase [Nitrospinota bacterium]